MIEIKLRAEGIEKKVLTNQISRSFVRISPS